MTSIESIEADVTFRSRRAYTWLSCRDKTCCTRTVTLTGADIARIAAGLAVEPWHFVGIVRTYADDPAGLAFDAGPDRYVLVLQRNGTECVFLMRTRSGVGRCGLGEQAPTSCRMFPATVGGGEPGREACTCREWTDYEIEGEDTAALRRAAIAEREAWYATVGRWNEFAATAADGALTLADVLRYALDVQATLDKGADW
jgi:Fe-S-cluster containining protein